MQQDRFPTRESRPEVSNESRIDVATVPHILGMPRYMYRSVLLRALLGTLRSRLHGDPVGAFESELWLWFFLGAMSQRRVDSRRRWRPSARDHQPAG